MTAHRHARLWTPITTVIGGTPIAAAIGIHQGWNGAIFSELVTLSVAVIYYFAGRQDSDVGAIIGHQPDERQQIVRAKAAQMSLLVALAAMAAGCLIAAAADTAFWPFIVIYVVTGLAYLIGLGVYGAEATTTERTTRTTVS